MKAIVHYSYGPPDVLELREIEKPVPTDDEVLVRVEASSVNALEWRVMTGTPLIARPMMGGIFKPSDPRLGIDVSGKVEAVGKNVTQFKPGDAVFGMRDGAFAEYVTGPEEAFAHKPENVSFEQAASVGVAGLTALQGLRDVGKVRAGHKVLINGAGGGVGVFAVQIAKYLGAEVTAVTSTDKLDMVKKIGADKVIDYNQDDFTKGRQTFDVVYDISANHSVSDTLRVVKLDGILMLIGSISKERLLGPIVLPLKAFLMARFVRQKLAFFIAKRKREDLIFLGDLLRTGKLVPVIDKTYRLAETPRAVAYVQKGQAKGKVIVNVAA